MKEVCGSGGDTLFRVLAEAAQSTVNQGVPPPAVLKTEEVFSISAIHLWQTHLPAGTLAEENLETKMSQFYLKEYNQLVTEPEQKVSTLTFPRVMVIIAKSETQKCEGSSLDGVTQLEGEQA